MNLRGAAVHFCGENREQKSDAEKGDGHPSRETGEDIRGLGAEDIVGDPPAKGRAEAFAAWSLHQDHEHQQQTNDDMQHHQNGH